MILVIIFKAIVFWLAVGSAVWEQTLSSEDKHSDFFTLLMFPVKTGFLFFGPLCDCIVMVWWKHYVLPVLPVLCFFWFFFNIIIVMKWVLQEAWISSKKSDF